MFNTTQSNLENNYVTNNQDSDVSYIKFSHITSNTQPLINLDNCLVEENYLSIKDSLEISSNNDIVSLLGDQLES